MALTKADLAMLLSERIGFTKREAKDMVESIFEELRCALERRKHVKLAGFGDFKLRDKAQRPGRNPKTGEAIPIRARRVVLFHASNQLRAMIEQNCNNDALQPHGARKERVGCTRFPGHLV